ncbi:MAG: AAA family ATPase [Methyloprofundus sp.]|nr:AAA family ATPase [Methyloprofundus sp.]MDT8426178.1 AAA family ATPase [Methyloprofundus sp.]
MYTKFYGLTKKPFSLIPDPSFLYLSAKHKKALTTLQYGLVSQAGFTVITGEIGSGKTTLVRSLLEKIQAQCEVGLITNTHSAFGDLLTWVLAAFNIESTASNKAERYRAFVDFITEKSKTDTRVVLIVDEAQNMDIQTLEELRLLSNINTDQQIMLQLILVGQPELVDKLNQPELVQFSQRISIEYHLNPLSYEETEQYIDFRLKVAGSTEKIFQPSACAALFYYSGGVPRLINNLGDLALVFAFAADKKKINWKVIVDVVSERTTGGIKRFEGKICLSPNIIERAAEAEKLRRALLEATGVDISKSL